MFRSVYAAVPRRMPTSSPRCAAAVASVASAVPSSSSSRRELRMLFTNSCTRLWPLWKLEACGDSCSHATVAVQRSLLSSTTANTAATPTATGSSSPAAFASASTAQEKTKDTNTKSTNNNSSSSNVFLDHLGTIFLSAIGCIVAWLMRSYYNTKARNLLRDSMEQTAAIDPIELDDLRAANSELTRPVFMEIQKHVLRSALARTPAVVTEDANTDTGTTMTYPDFVTAVRTAMLQHYQGDPSFTIQLGHLLDRVAAAAVLKPQLQEPQPQHHGIYNANTVSADTTKRSLELVQMPVQFWLTLLSLALSETPTERIHVLYDILQTGSNNNIIHHHTNNYDSNDDTVNDSSSSDSASPLLSIDQVVAMVGYLQDSCQLTPDTQIVDTTNKYPLQEYVVGTPSQLVDRHSWLPQEQPPMPPPPPPPPLETNQMTRSSNNNNNSNGNDQTATSRLIDRNAFADILRSKSVCAWGECYRPKKLGG